MKKIIYNLDKFGIQLNQEVFYEKNLFKRLTAGALALLMLGTALPSGSDFTGLFGGSDIVASAAKFSGI